MVCSYLFWSSSGLSLSHSNIDTPTLCRQAADEELSKELAPIKAPIRAFSTGYFDATNGMCFLSTYILVEDYLGGDYDPSTDPRTEEYYRIFMIHQQNELDAITYNAQSVLVDCDNLGTPHCNVNQNELQAFRPQLSNLPIPSEMSTTTLKALTSKSCALTAISPSGRLTSLCP
jgi:hypothetical protein